MNFRKQINQELKASPSLIAYLEKVFDECYQDGREIAEKRLPLSLDTFPMEPIGNHKR